MISGNLEIRFGSERHQKILTNIRSRRDLAEREMEGRFEKWRNQDRQAIAYIKEQDLDKIRKGNKKTKGVVDYTTIEVPYSYGMMMSAHTFWTSVFLSRQPILQFSGRHGETQQQVMGVEALMGYQTTTGGHTLPYYIWLYDAAKYGIGIMGKFWETEVKNVSRIIDKPEMFLGQPTGKTRKVRQHGQIKGYEGNKLFNVRPYDFIFDPRVSAANLQKGEFCGRRFDLPWSEIVHQMNQGLYFNREELEKRRVLRQRRAGERGAEEVDYPDPDQDIPQNPSDDRGYAELLELHVRIIPKEWELGSGDLPEKWVFTLADDAVVIGARPLGEYHDHFPFYVIEQEIDGYLLFKRGMMEQMQPMNDVMTWLFNSHFYNVRAALNNQFIYDPSRLYTKDVLDPAPGKMIRMKPDAYGQDVRSMFTQIPVADVTRAHIGDVGNVGELMQRATGVADNIMGQVNSGGRKTATEVRTSSSFSANRLKTVAEYMSAMGFQPLAQDMLASTQQHYSDQKKFRIVGDLSTEDPFIDVSPESIAGAYDFVAVDGTFPVDRFAQANLWKEILAGVRNMPQVAAEFDLSGIFIHMAQLAGLRNIKQFKVRTVPDDVLEQQVDAGNSIPIKKPRANPNEPKQVGRLGPTA